MASFHYATSLEKLLICLTVQKFTFVPFKSPEYLIGGVVMDIDLIVKGDRLILRGLKFHGYHGVKPEEKKLGQKFLIDVDAWLDLRKAGESDCLSDTVSYTDIYRIVKEIVEGTPQNLLESVAQLIASTTFAKFPQISSIRVKVGKPHVAVPGQLDYLGVEILRSRNAGGA
ncbi:Dihydroneopterin aldolase/epimerase domain [Dillenia turbinata]|uniref:7,8-dihydroneopterin aldolase n=1 Tax=Dillenia turbinata TaxID=194707 RepID=A0AAN8Z682_9MAGN